MQLGVLLSIDTIEEHALARDPDPGSRDILMADWFADWMIDEMHADEKVDEQVFSFGSLIACLFVLELGMSRRASMHPW